MATEPQTHREIEELRRVLLKPEALVDKISPVIADILAEQIQTSKDEIARALAPAIGEAIRQQVYQAREDIIDALYPVIGAMIARAVTEAIRDLVTQIDMRLRTGPMLLLDPGFWRARAQGISAGEYALRKQLPFSVQEIFLIQRDSGLLICHIAAPGVPVADRDLVSGMLTAIRDFARDALGEGDELGAISYESRQIVIASGSAAYLAAVITGVEPSGFREQLRQTLVAIHEGRYDRLRAFSGDDQHLVTEAEAIIRQQISLATVQLAKPKPANSFVQRAIITLLLLIALSPIFFCGWWVISVEARMAALFAPTATPTATPTPTSTPTATPTPTSTPTATPTPTSTPTATPTPTSTPMPTATPIPYDGVMTGNVYLYSFPDEASERSPIVAPRNSPVVVLAQYGDWYQVRVDMRIDQRPVQLIGWVPSRWVGLVRPIPPEIVTPFPRP